MTRLDVLDVPTDAQRFDDAVATLLAWASDPAARRYVSTCPVYTLMLCRENPAVRSVVGGADMITADGMPVVWLQRWLGVKEAERVYGPDLLLALCDQGRARGVRHYLWGGLPGVADALAAELHRRYPGVEIVGTHAPPVASLKDAPDEDAIARLNGAGAHIVWVGLGSPKQDAWMALHRPYLHTPVLIGVGAAFDMLSGAKAQAPRWMQRTGTEWLFRLLQEPRRLGRRYLVYNPKFVWSALRAYGLKRR